MRVTTCRTRRGRSGLQQPRSVGAAWSSLPVSAAVGSVFAGVLSSVSMGFLIDVFQSLDGLANVERTLLDDPQGIGVADCAGLTQRVRDGVGPQRRIAQRKTPNQ